MRGRQRKLGKLIIPIGVILICIWVFLPFYLATIVSLSSGKGAVGFEFPPKVTLEAYKSILFTRHTLWKYWINSIITAVSATVIVLFFSIPCGYGLSRSQSLKIKGTVHNSFFFLQLVPPIVLSIPLYIMFNKLGAHDTLYGLTVVLASLNLPFGTLVMKGFFDTIPRALEEAAWIDGATIPQTITKIIVPLLAQGSIAVGVITFLMAYIHYLLAMVLTDMKAVTLPMYISQFSTQYRVYIPEMLAGALLGTIPMIVLYGFVQKYMKAFTMTGFY